MDSPFSKYTGGIAPMEGIAETGARIAKADAEARNAGLQNLVNGIAQYAEIVEDQNRKKVESLVNQALNGGVDPNMEVSESLRFKPLEFGGEKGPQNLDDWTEANRKAYQDWQSQISKVAAEQGWSAPKFDDFELVMMRAAKGLSDRLDDTDMTDMSPQDRETFRSGLAGLQQGVIAKRSDREFNEFLDVYMQGDDATDEEMLTELGQYLDAGDATAAAKAEVRVTAKEGFSMAGNQTLAQAREAMVASIRAIPPAQRTAKQADAIARADAAAAATQKPFKLGLPSVKANGESVNPVLRGLDTYEKVKEKFYDPDPVKQFQKRQAVYEEHVQSLYEIWKNEDGEEIANSKLTQYYAETMGWKPRPNEEVRASLGTQYTDEDEANYQARGTDRNGSRAGSAEYFIVAKFNEIAEKGADAYDVTAGVAGGAALTLATFSYLTGSPTVQKAVETWKNWSEEKKAKAVAERLGTVRKKYEARAGEKKSTGVFRVDETKRKKSKGPKEDTPPGTPKGQRLITRQLEGAGKDDVVSVTDESRGVTEIKRTVDDGKGGRVAEVYGDDNKWYRIESKTDSAGNTVETVMEQDEAGNWKPSANQDQGRFNVANDAASLERAKSTFERSAPQRAKAEYEKGGKKWADLPASQRAELVRKADAQKWDALPDTEKARLVAEAGEADIENRLNLASGNSTDLETRSETFRRLAEERAKADYEKGGKKWDDLPAGEKAELIKKGQRGTFGKLTMLERLKGKGMVRAVQLAAIAGTSYLAGTAEEAYTQSDPERAIKQDQEELFNNGGFDKILSGVGGIASANAAAGQQIVASTTGVAAQAPGKAAAQTAATKAFAPSSLVMAGVGMAPRAKPSNLYTQQVYDYVLNAFPDADPDVINHVIRGLRPNFEFVTDHESGARFVAIRDPQTGAFKSFEQIKSFGEQDGGPGVIGRPVMGDDGRVRGYTPLQYGGGAIQAMGTFAPGTDKGVADKVNESFEKLGRALDLVQRMEVIFDKHGTEAYGEKAAYYRAASFQIAAMFRKELGDSGVLTNQDVERLMAQIPDPSGFFNGTLSLDSSHRARFQFIKNFIESKVRGDANRYGIKVEIRQRFYGSERDVMMGTQSRDAEIAARKIQIRQRNQGTTR